MASKAVLLLSGGMDSVVTGAVARKRGRELYALSVAYGQAHAVELDSAKRQARQLGVRFHRVVDLDLRAVGTGALLDAGPLRSRTPAGRRPATYLPFRNGVFLALAAAWAETLQAAEVWGGWCFSDHAGYPDCTPGFFRAFERTVRAGTWAGRDGARFRIVAPLGRLDKARTIRLGRRLGVDFAQTWTCYRPQGRGAAARACGRCEACRLRREGFAAAGGEDPAGPRRRGRL